MTERKMIYLDDAINAIIAEGRNVDSRYLESERIIHESDAVEALSMLPSAQPERPKGHWMLCDNQRREDIENGNYMYVCTNCLHSDVHAKTVTVPFCWHCGADMR